MPVLVTITTISLLFRRGSSVSFLDPAALRARIEGELDDSDERDRALVLVDKLGQLANAYDDSLSASIDAYVAESTNPASTAEDLITRLEPWDRTRRATLHEIMRISRSMLVLLTASKGERVFH